MKEKEFENELLDFIYDIIPTDRYISRKELKERLGISDRQIRLYISKIREKHNIISLSSVGGYRRAKSTDDMTQDEIKIECEIIKKQLKENNNRIKKIKYNMKSQIAYLKILEKNMK